MPENELKETINDFDSAPILETDIPPEQNKNIPLIQLNKQTEKNDNNCLIQTNIPPPDEDDKNKGDNKNNDLSENKNTYKYFNKSKANKKKEEY